MVAGCLSQNFKIVASGFLAIWPLKLISNSNKTSPWLLKILDSFLLWKACRRAPAGSSLPEPRSRASLGVGMLPLFYQMRRTQSSSALQGGSKGRSLGRHWGMHRHPIPDVQQVPAPTSQAANGAPAVVAWVLVTSVPPIVGPLGHPFQVEELSSHTGAWFTLISRFETDAWGLGLASVAFKFGSSLCHRELSSQLASALPCAFL